MIEYIIFCVSCLCTILFFLLTEIFPTSDRTVTTLSEALPYYFWEDQKVGVELQRNSLPPGVSECSVVLKASLPNCYEVFPEQVEPVSSIVSISVTSCPTKPYFITMVHRGGRDAQVFKVIRFDDGVVSEQVGGDGGAGGGDGVVHVQAGDRDGGGDDVVVREVKCTEIKTKTFSIKVSCTHSEEEFVVVSKKANAVFGAHVYFDDKEYNLHLTLARNIPVYTKVRCCPKWQRLVWS